MFWMCAALAFSLVAGTTRADVPGETLHVATSGNAPRIVLIPGLSGCGFGFRRVVSGLEAADVSWAVIEPLAVGASPRPAGADYSLTAQADRIASVLARLGGPPAVVVGHGVSASIALRLALRHPELVRSVVSVEGGPDENAATPTVDRSLKWASLAAKLGGRRLLRDRFEDDLIAASGDKSWITGHTLRRYFSHANRDLPAAINALRAMARAEEPQRLKENLSRISCPVLLLLGGAPHAGSLPPAEVAVLQNALADFEVHTVPGAGHFIFEEQPEVVVRSLIDLVATTVVALPERGGTSCAR